MSAYEEKPRAMQFTNVRGSLPNAPVCQAVYQCASVPGSTNVPGSLPKNELKS